MRPIDIKLDGDNCWPELAEMKAAGLLELGDLIGVALLPDAVITRADGTEARVPALTLRVRVQHPTDPSLHGGHVLVQLKVDTLEAIAAALRGRLQYLEQLSAQGGTPS